MSTEAQVVTRFAPSPTGYLHVGGARTALFCWLFARGRGGRFLLRIEDTDQRRNTPQAREAIFAGLRWLGLDHDGEAAFQSERLALYEQHFRKLLDDGRAYECFMTPGELEARRAEAKAANRDFRYDRAWAQITDEQRRAFCDEGRTPVLRFAMPSGDITVSDEVFGEVTTPGDQLEDFVIRKSDGFPTYHFAVVVDDATMGVTHVIRGQEHLGNTPRHVALQRALGFDQPAWAHLPILLNPDGSKISKRQDDPGLWDKGFPPVRVDDYRRRGYLPEAMFNFLALLGWNPGDDREIMTRDELLAAFDLGRINQSNARFDVEKLDWMNGQYIQNAPDDLLVSRLTEWLAGSDYPLREADEAALRRVLPLYRPRARTLTDFAENSGFFFTDSVELDAQAVQRVLLRGQAEGLEHLKAIRRRLARVKPFDPGPLEESINRYCEQAEVKLGKVAQPIRVAVSGGTVSPPIFDTLACLGRERTLARIDAAIARCETVADESPGASDESSPAES